MPLILVTAVLIAGCLFVNTLPALASPINEDTLWADLQRTATLIQVAIDHPENRSGTLQQVQALWQGVDSVRLSDAKGTLVPLDLTWVHNLGPNTDSATLTQLESRLQSILKDGSPDDAAGLMNALNSVLKDPRFQYVPTPTPTVAPTDTFNNPISNNEPSPPETAIVPPALAQGFLVLVTIITLIVLLGSLARRLRNQPLALPKPVEDEPATSAEARDRAEVVLESQDYRTAIRYLYLASLLLLDERGVIHYDRTLTNREHLRAVAGEPQVSAALRPVVETFDRVWYGFEPVDEDRFATFRADVDRLMGIAP